MSTTTFYKGHSNSATLLLTVAGEPFDYSTITNVVLEYDGGAESISSTDNPEAITVGLSSILLALGLADIDIGIYQMRLLIYTDTDTDGSVWSDSLSIAIK